MTEGRRIIVATDLSDASAAPMREAGRLAREQAASLTVVYVFDPMPQVPPATVPRDEAALGEMAGRLRTGTEQALERHCAELLPGQPALNRVIREDISPVRAVCAVAEELAADLIIVGTHGRTGLRRMLVGSVAEGIVRNAPCNVLVVRAVG